MDKNKHDILRDLEEYIENKRRQPIYSDEEKRKLQEAERRIAEAAEIAQQTDEGGGRLRVFEDSKKVEVDGEDIRLTLTEFELFRKLQKHGPKAFTRQQLLESVWGEEQDLILATERTVDAHIRNIRKKFGDLGDRIVTVRGIGYRYNDQA